MNITGAQENTCTLVTEIWPPFRIEDISAEKGYGGIDIDLANELEKRMNISIDLVFCSWARALEEIKTGKADLILGLAYSEQRAEYTSYVPTSYASVEPVFYTGRGKRQTVKTYDNLSGLDIGLSRASVYFEPFNSDESLNKIYLTTEKQILDMLVLGRIDLGVGTNPNMAYDIARFGYRDKLELTDYRPEHSTKLYLGISKRSVRLSMTDAFDKALKDILEDGTMEKILSKYR